MEKSLRRTCPPDLKVIETFRVEGGVAIRLDLHLDRLKRTCLSLGITLDRGRVQQCLQKLPATGVYRVRLTVGLEGVVDLQCVALGPAMPEWNVAVAQPRLSSGDPWLQIKTTQRALYDETRKTLPRGVDEWIFLNERDEVCEGTITNIFVERSEVFLTPPTVSGLLPGVLRESLLVKGRAREQVLRLEDLQDGFWLGNSLRGLIPAKLV
ncbi:aminotransferase class IV [Thioclava kandeliae]|uniref:Probable branched-chain-amino-acid aminotransferase n=1 Tax=Thioclava kandeliae TaxID=3070818 RepID=A0ABV1SD97_9RHOB